MKENMEQALRQTFCTVGEALEAPEYMKTRIDVSLRAAKPQRGSRLRRGVIAAVCTLAIVTTGVFAATSMAGLSATGWANQRWDLEKTSAQAGVTLPNALPNGFSFDYGYEVSSKATGDMGETLDKWKDTKAVYARDGIALDLTVREAGAKRGTFTPELTENVGGVMIGYRDDTYVSVPEEAVLSAQDAQRERDGEIVVSYGSDAREEQQYQYVGWQKDGKNYSLSGYDTGLTADELMALAAALAA